MRTLIGRILRRGADQHSHNLINSMRSVLHRLHIFVEGKINTEAPDVDPVVVLTAALDEHVVCIPAWNEMPLGKLKLGKCKIIFGQTVRAPPPVTSPPHTLSLPIYRYSATEVKWNGNAKWCKYCRYLMIHLYWSWNFLNLSLHDIRITHIWAGHPVRSWRSCNCCYLTLRCRFNLHCVTAADQVCERV